MILCNPHNPIGKIWCRDELEQIGNLCKKYNVTVVSDEIHCDITTPGKDYVPFALGKADKATVKFLGLKEGSIATSLMKLSDTFDTANTDYYRPSYHFTPFCARRTSIQVSAFEPVESITWASSFSSCTGSKR